MAILVTGGAGYIGSHTCIELINKDKEVIVLDNLSNSNYEAIDRIKEITGKNIKFYEVDITNEKELELIFKENLIDSVMHFAGVKAVEESVFFPIKYYENNVMGTVVLCKVMRKFGCKKIIFSSSATVYGMNNKPPFSEDMEASTINPYGKTKLVIEGFLQELYKSDNQWSIIILRYFNPVGAHKSGLIGENPNGVPKNLFPIIIKAAMNEIPYVNIYGSDYKTIDGSCVRDYIHVCDVASGHVLALTTLNNRGVEIFNLGMGKGYSVLEMISTFEKVNGIKVNYKFAPRRIGDIENSYADITKAKELLGWCCKYNIYDMCLDSWNFRLKNSRII